MAGILVNFEGASIRKAGVYSKTKVAVSASAQPQLGIVAIVGEAEEGPAWAEEGGVIANVAYTPDQFQQIVAKYGSGNLVNAAKTAFGPSNDEQIQGGAQLLYVLKTNTGVKAQLAVPTGYGTLKAKRAGTPGNALSSVISIAASKATITVSDDITGESEISPAIGLTTAMTIQCTDPVSTVATMTVTDTTLTTTITGGTAANLSISLAQYPTIQSLVDYINTKPGYSASVGANQGSQSVSVFDRVTAANILVAYNLLRDAYDVRAWFAQSAFVDFTPTLYVGIPTTLAKTYFAGGLKGPTLAASVTAAYDALMKARINFIVPLFARDATTDITDSLTDPSSTYAISSVHVGLRSHCSSASTIKGRKERQGMAAIKDTYANTKLAASALATARVSLNFQDVDVQDAVGNLGTAQPWMGAVVNAGMKAAANVGLSNLYKLANINGFTHATFDPETDYDDAIAAGLCFFEKAPGGGIRFAIDNSTYQQDKDAWIWSRPAVIYAADTAAYTLRLNLEQFVGQRNSDITPETVKNMLVGVLDGLRGAGIIVADTNTGGKGYKDLLVTFEGSVCRVGVTLALVENIEFILLGITVQRAVA